MITAFIYILRRTFRIGIPFFALWLAFNLFGWYIEHIWIFRVISIGVLCGFLIIIAIFLTVTWDIQEERICRRDIKNDVKEAKAYLFKIRIPKNHQLTQGSSDLRSGNEPPTIYDGETIKILRKESSDEN